MRHFVGIIALALAAAILYGIAHDEVTARVCPEYFTVYHPPILGGTKDPTLLGLGWGVIATWWVGLPLGILLGCAAHVGPLPPLGPRDLLRPLGIMLCCMGIIAAGAGFLGYAGTRVSSLDANGPPTTTRSSSAVPSNADASRRSLNADRWAHNASYTAGIVGAFILCGFTIRRRLYLALALSERTDVSAQTDGT